MAKRKNEEELAISNGTTGHDATEPVTKKAKKDKKIKSRREKVASDGVEKEKKKKRKEKGVGEGADKDVVQEGVVEESVSERLDNAEAAADLTGGPNLDKAASKAAKKALKRAKREQDEAADTGAADVDADKAAAKMERKALKRAKRDAESATEQNGMARTIGDATAKSTNGDAKATNGAHAQSGYTEDAALGALPQSEIDAFIAEKFITVTDDAKLSPIYRPITSFSYLPITDEAQRTPFAAYTTPTPIQAAAWPYLFAGRDVIGVAETGSGKTMGFGVPCIRHISSLPAKEQKKGIRACIVSPTRELALQIHEQLVKLATPAGLKVTCVYGGVNKDQQRETIKGASIIVATPGRLNDFLSEKSVDLSNVRYAVLDEADRMLDKGFEEEVRKILSSTSSLGRQTLMFTATWPESVRKLAATFMNSPVRINIGDNPTGELRANQRITQEVRVVDPREKNDILVSLLRKYQSGKNKGDKVLVFCLYKKEATRIEGFIRSRGFEVAGIHGDLSQQQRTASLEAFKQGKVPLLVATDVAARGLDIPAVKVVINVTFPLTVEDYVHRIGR